MHFVRNKEGMMAKETGKNSNSKQKIRIVVALIGAFAIIIAAVIAILPSVLDKEISESELRVHVSNPEGRSVENAKIVLFYEYGPEVGYTDSNGYKNLIVNTKGSSQGRLFIETDDYAIETRELSLPNNSTQDIKLREIPKKENKVIVRVIDDDDNRPITEAKVLMALEGKIFTDSTDSNGVSTFTIPGQEAFVDTMISVEAKGFNIQDQNITVATNKIQDIRLFPEMGGANVAQLDPSVKLDNIAFQDVGQISRGPELSPQIPTATLRSQISAPPLGWPIEHEGIQINIVNSEIRTESEYESAALFVRYSVLNKSPQKLLIEFNADNTFAQDTQKVKYVDWESDKPLSFWLEAGQLKLVERHYSKVPKEKSRIHASALPVTVHIENLNGVFSGAWTLGGPAVGTYSEGESSCSFNESCPSGSFDFVLSQVEIRSISEYDSAAFLIVFNIKNTSTERKLLEFDYANIFVEDNFGNRYIDWEGAGLSSKWLEPDKDYKFERYYSSQRNTRSRIPADTQFVVVISEGMGNEERLTWKIPIEK
jgi:hypothetical protein